MHARRLPSLRPTQPAILFMWICREEAEHRVTLVSPDPGRVTAEARRGPGAHLAEDGPHGRVLEHREAERHDRVEGGVHGPFGHALLKVT